MLRILLECAPSETLISSEYCCDGALSDVLEPELSSVDVDVLVEDAVLVDVELRSYTSNVILAK